MPDTKPIVGRQAGFTMVELMVALALGLLLSAAVLQAFVGAKKTYEFQQEFSRIQENGRFAMEFMSRDIRQADFWGCIKDGDQIRSIVNGYTDTDVFATGVLASDAIASSTSGYAPSLGPLADSITLQGGGEGGIPVISTPTTVNASLFIDKLDHPLGDTIADGDILLVTDCTEAVLFQVTNTNSTNVTVVHNSGTGTPGNTQQGLGYIFGPDATVYNYSGGVRYWLRIGTSGEPVLVRGSDSDAWDTGGDELVEGVENLQLLYGEDTDSDGTPNYFVAADQVSDMDDVVSVQVHLLVRSLRDNILDDPQSINYYGQGRIANDRYMRKAFTTTIALRNRLN